MPRTAEPAIDLADALDAIAKVPTDSLDPATVDALDVARRAIVALGNTETATWAVKTQPTISVVQYANLIGINRITAYEHVERGDIPSIKVGRRRRIPAAVVRRQLGIEDA
ncbi:MULTISPECIES: excisionase family DNA-binding protein [unclassified Gordonia (in: high G+C Gram-positive bacteria)]|uniref:excisionase family DNA-binding protein n=1 Tax=unclassified Gordonia (in: high G+C Gram-positive bacteria) TaxID=2657482 RepID=UPI001CFA8B50|nr:MULTISPECIES: excisionase family DNA-binding protein [unclassified Gordonia (in: high G+C Gram-positive bacteria)]MCT1353839.1 excisionase family DNA-binding protein [Gordonia sp. p3-SID1431]UCZ91267.1 excisionase family DNA-binding protein [Gordonia sp. WA4-43]